MMSTLALEIDRVAKRLDAFVIAAGCMDTDTQADTQMAIRRMNAALAAAKAAQRSDDASKHEIAVGLLRRFQ